MELYEVDQMSELIKNEYGLSMENQMKAGYEEMGMLNAGLSEEGLDQDRRDLENYEKFLVESE